MTAKSTLGFLFLPVQRRDFANLGYQASVVTRGLAHVYHRLGLVDEHTVERGTVLPLAVLAAASCGWIAKWAPILGAGWRDGDGEGILGHIGGLSHAVLAGRDKIVTDTTAVAIGWILFLAAIIAGMSMSLDGVVSVAHAATAANADLARDTLGTLFSFLGAGTVLAQGLGQIAKVMSVAAFTLAGISALWTTGVLAVEYTIAPDSARQRYTPWLFALRIATALGLLAPLGGGWSGGQQLVGFAGAWGSDKASEAWTAMSSYLGDSKAWVVKPIVSETNILQTITTLASAEACRAAINLDPARKENELVEERTTGDTIRYDYFIKGMLFGWNREAAGGCGSIQFPSLSSGAVGSATDGVMAAHKSSFLAMRKDLRSAVEGFISNRIACRDNPGACAADPDNSGLGTLPASYRGALEAGISNAWTAANGASGQKVSTEALAKGWIGAGEWAQTLSKFQGSITAAGTAMPMVTPPQLKDVGGPIDGVQAWVGDALMTSGNAILDAQLGVTSGMDGAVDRLGKATVNYAWSTLVSVDENNALSGLSTRGMIVYGTGLTLLAATSGIEAVAGMLSGGKADGEDKSVVANALDRARSGVTAAAAKRFPLMALLAGIGGAIKPIINGASLALIIVGLALAYLVPALPFIRYYFAIIGWLIAFFECVMLVPVSLVLLVTAETGGFFGPAAKAGFWNIVGLILRPILALGGFVIGLMLITVSMGLLNKMMLPMVRDVMDNGYILVAFVAYMVIYLGLAYVAVNSCTKVAELLPSAAYRWIGANAGGERDDGGAVAGAIGGAASRVMTEIGMRARAAGRAKT